MDGQSISFLPSGISSGIIVIEFFRAALPMFAKHNCRSIPGKGSILNKKCFALNEIRKQVKRIGVGKIPEHS